MPDNLIKREQEAQRLEREKQIKVRHAPLALDITLRDRNGVPLHDQVVSSRFGAPKPVGA